MKEALSRGGSQVFQVLGIACAKAQRHKKRSRFDVVGDKVGGVKKTGRDLSSGGAVVHVGWCYRCGGGG